METIVNNPPPADSGSGAWTVVGIIIGIIVVLLLLYYGVPALRSNPSTDDGSSINVDVNLPTNGGNSSGGTRGTQSY